MRSTLLFIVGSMFVNDIETKNNNNACRIAPYEASTKISQQSMTYRCTQTLRFS